MPVIQNVAPLTISFTNTSQGDNLSYLWNFGDGGTTTTSNPTHTFQAGTWEVTLTVTNDNGTDVSSAVVVATPSSGGGYGNSGYGGYGGEDGTNNFA